MPIAVGPSFPLTTRLRAWLYIVALLAIAAFAHTENNVTPLVVGMIVAVVAWLLAGSPNAPSLKAVLPGLAAAGVPGPDRREAFLRRLVAYAPRILVNGVVLAAAGYLWVQVRVGPEPGNPGMIVAVAHFMEVLLLCKLFESRTLRDSGQILVLSLLLVLSATMSNSNLFFFLILVVCFAALFYVAVLLNLFAETGRFADNGPPAAPVAGNGGARDAAPRSAPWALLRRDLREAARQCLFLVLPVALLLFLVLPRYPGNPFLSSWGLGSLQTGFSETVRLRDFGTLQPSNDEVMRVTLRRGDEDVSGEFSDLYFRGQVLNQYSERGVWSHAPPFFRTGTSPAARAQAPADDEDLPLRSLPIQVTYDYAKFPVNGRLFVLAPCIVSDDERFEYSYVDMTCRLAQDGARLTGPLKYTLGWARDLAPRTEGRPNPAPGVLASVSVQTSDGTVVQKPTVMVSRQIDELAHHLIKNLVPAGDPVGPEQVRGVMTIFESYLRNNFAYSATFLRVDQSLERTTDFLLNRKATGGNCEYFASAMVMLCRAVGLNARMVSGYHSDEYYPAGFGPGYFQVRQKHAHTWAEVFIPGQGWVLSDPTPDSGAGDAGGLTGNWLRDLGRVVQGTWLTSVVSFDNESRAAIAQWFSTLLGAVLKFSADMMPLLWGVLLALVAMLIWLRRRARRLQPLPDGSRAGPRRPARLPAHVPFLDDLLRLFDPAATRRADLTPLEFLEPFFARLTPAAAARARWLVVTAYGVRFGALRVDADLGRDIAFALRCVRSDPHFRP